MINPLACFNGDFITPADDEAFEEAAARLISKVRTIAAYTYPYLLWAKPYDPSGGPFVPTTVVSENRAAALTRIADEVDARVSDMRRKSKDPAPFPGT